MVIGWQDSGYRCFKGVFRDSYAFKISGTKIKELKCDEYQTEIRTDLNTSPYDIKRRKVICKSKICLFMNILGNTTYMYVYIMQYKMAKHIAVQVL